jgi:anti-sigma factor RsiW
MGMSTPGQACRWVRDRLPLFEGGELTGTERRKVERHLIGCPDCRRCGASLAEALGALHAAAACASVSADAPTLWPALQRQIREARHQRRPALSILPLTFPEVGSWLELLAVVARSYRPRLCRASVLASVLVVGGLAAAGVDLWSRWQTADALVNIRAAAQPLDLDEDFDPASIVISIPLPSALDTASPVANLAQANPGTSAGVSAGATSATAPVGYDLDHGTPMGPDTQDVKASY